MSIILLSPCPAFQRWQSQVDARRIDQGGPTADLLESHLKMKAFLTFSTELARSILGHVQFVGPHCHCQGVQHRSPLPGDSHLHHHGRIPGRMHPLTTSLLWLHTWFSV